MALSSSGPSVFGQAVTFTATVTAVPPGAGTPNGTLEFVIDGNPQSPVPVDGTTGKATFVVTDFSNYGAGTHTITANYLGAANFAPNSTPATPITQSVGKASTSMTVSSTGSGHTVYDHDVTFTATVTSLPPGSGTPNGFVRFVIDGLPRTPVAVDSTGHATLTLSHLNAGNHSAGGDYLTNFRTQINWGLNYVKERYGSPCGALNFHLANNWY